MIHLSPLLPSPTHRHFPIMGHHERRKHQVSAENPDWSQNLSLRNSVLDFKKKIKHDWSVSEGIFACSAYCKELCPSNFCFPGSFKFNSLRINNYSCSICELWFPDIVSWNLSLNHSYQHQQAYIWPVWRYVMMTELCITVVVLLLLVSATQGSRPTSDQFNDM